MDINCYKYTVTYGFPFWGSLNEGRYGVFQQSNLHSNDIKQNDPVSSNKSLLFYVKNKVPMPLVEAV